MEQSDAVFSVLKFKICFLLNNKKNGEMLYYYPLFKHFLNWTFSKSHLPYSSHNIPSYCCILVVQVCSTYTCSTFIPRRLSNKCNLILSHARLLMSGVGSDRVKGLNVAGKITGTARRISSVSDHVSYAVYCDTSTEGFNKNI